MLLKLNLKQKVKKRSNSLESNKSEISFTTSTVTKNTFLSNNKLHIMDDNLFEYPKTESKWIPTSSQS